MEIDEFKERISKCEEYEDVDDLVLEWLRSVLEQNGAEGAIGLQLLEIVSTLLP